MGDVSVGDIEIPYLDVTPAGPDTAGTLLVTDPDGTQTAIPVTAGPLGETAAGEPTRRLTGQAVTYGQDRRWVLSWTVTGTGAGSEDWPVWVVPRPTAGGPAWLPGRSRVANYVPHRTMSVEAETHELSFSSRTRPTGAMVDRLIADAAARITGRVGDIHDSLGDTASVIAAMLAAAAVERGYPDDQDTTQSLTRARDLERVAEQMLTELATANEAAGETPISPGANLLPRWAFPPPVPWGDRLDTF